MPIDQKSHLNEVEFNRPGFHEWKLVWAAAVFKETLLKGQIGHMPANRDEKGNQRRVQTYDFEVGGQATFQAFDLLRNSIGWVDPAHSPSADSHGIARMLRSGAPDGLVCVLATTLSLPAGEQ